MEILCHMFYITSQFRFTVYANASSEGTIAVSIFFPHELFHICTLQYMFSIFQNVHLAVLGLIVSMPVESV